MALGLCHPGFWSKIGGSYATDGTAGVGVSPWRTGWTRTLILWDYASWDRRPAGEIAVAAAAVLRRQPDPAARRADHRPAAAGQPAPRLAASAGPLSRAFSGHLRPGAYDADYRWIASDYMNHSQQASRRRTPTAFTAAPADRSGRRRGRPSATRSTPALRSAGGQGVICGARAATIPAAAMYRPDFDVLPPEVDAQWPILARRFREAGLKLGVATRPRDMAVRRDWKRTRSSPSTPTTRPIATCSGGASRRMIDKGCTLFYLDSFGDSYLEDVKLMQFLRERWAGRSVLRRAPVRRHPALLRRLFGDELHAGRRRPTLSRLVRMENWEIYQWLVPGAQLVSRLYEVKGAMPADFEPVDRFFYRQRITPLLPVSDFAARPG